MADSKHLLKVIRVLNKIYPFGAWKETNLHNLVQDVTLSSELQDRIQEASREIRKSSTALLRRMRVDLYVPGQVAIEVHGEQHDRPVRFSNEILDPASELARRQLYDEIKARALQEAGVPFVTLWYHELDDLTVDDLSGRIAAAQSSAQRVPAYKTRNVKPPKHRTATESFEARKRRLDEARKRRKERYRARKAYLKAQKEQTNG